MISPEQIKKKAIAWYPDVLASYINGVPYFPKDIRFGKVQACDIHRDYKQVDQGIINLRNGLKDGYRIEFEKKYLQKLGQQSLPKRIYFDNLTDYLKFIDKKEEYKGFVGSVDRILFDLPELRTWMGDHPGKIIENIGRWDNLIKVCRYFISNPKPNMYARELPISVPTKFIEENNVIIKSLLDILIPNDIDVGESDFSRRFHLKYDEKLIRVRILDGQLSEKMFSGIDDISIPFSMFASLNISCKRVFIFENHANFSNVFNFLTLPHLSDSIAVFGKGFQISLLKNATWLSDKQLIYWGDIDVHGFQILSQLRGYFPNTQSCLMDFETFNMFEEFTVTGPNTTVKELKYLTFEEHSLFNYLLGRYDKNRLEQEKIPHVYAVERILSLVGR